MEDNKRKKKDLLILTKLQLKIVGFFSSIYILTVSIYMIGISQFFSKLESFGIKAKLPPHHIFYNFVDKQYDIFFHSFILYSFVFLGILVIGGIIVSHKIAGPIHRLCEHFKENSNPKIPLNTIKFRKNDSILNVEVAFNHMVEKRNGN